MVIFIISIITAIVGMYIGFMLGKAEIFMYIGAIIGLSLPYAFVLEKIFKEVCKDEVNKWF